MQEVYISFRKEVTLATVDGSSWIVVVHRELYDDCFIKLSPYLPKEYGTLAHREYSGHIVDCKCSCRFPTVDYQVVQKYIDKEILEFTDAVQKALDLYNRIQYETTILQQNAVKTVSVKCTNPNQNDSDNLYIPPTF